MQFHLVEVSLFFKTWRYLQPIARKKDLISMYWGALVSGNVNISVYFNKLANSFLTACIEPP